MASIYRNGKYFWIKLRHPSDGRERRVSLQTGSQPLADLLKKKWEASCEFHRLEIQEASFPAPLQALVPSHWSPLTNLVVAVSKPGKPLGELVNEFIEWCRSANDPKHAAGKAAILRAAFGKDVLQGATPDGPLAVESLEHLTCAQVLAFIEARPGRKGEKLADSSKRHYKECFVQLWNFSLQRSHIVPTNVAFPNPMNFLPEWETNGEEIIFLTLSEIKEQLAILVPFPSLHASVATMIHAGLRRAEALWLRKESMRKTGEERYLSVRKVSDGPLRQALKTKGSFRSVTLAPELAVILDEHVQILKSQWLFPSPTGVRWDKDHFSQNLAKINAQHGLKWSAMHYRHTYATQRAANGCSVFALAHEMGTSVAMIMTHYAAFFPPSALR